MGLRTILVCLLAAGCGGNGSGTDGGNGIGTTCTSGKVQDAVVTKMKFVEQPAPGVSPGFNLDDRVSPSQDEATCGIKDLKDPDGREGIDNQLSVLVPVINRETNNALDGLLQGAINNGMLLVGFTFKHLESRKDDDCVDVEIRHLKGTPAVGSDGILDANQTFDTVKGDPVSIVRGTVRGGVVEAGPFEAALPVKILDANFILKIHRARVRITLRDDGTLSGLLGGGIAKQDILDNLLPLGIGENLKKVLPGTLDTIADLDRDEMGKCRQFSSAILVDGKNAFINP